VVAVTYTVLPARGDDRFSEAEHVVEASHTEIVDLWYRWGELSGVPMVVDGDAWQAKVAVVADRAMVAWVIWARVAGACVAFVDLIEHSQVWERDVAETWQRLSFPRLRPPGAWRERHHRASRFTDVLDEIAGHDRLPMRSNTQILRAVKAVSIPARPTTGAPVTTLATIPATSMDAIRPDESRD
jgi:hypothetical protein